MDKYRSKRSSVWNHFDLEADAVICKLCKQRLKKQEGTSNMRNHMKYKHPMSLSLETTAQSSNMGGGDVEKAAPKRTATQTTLFEFAPKRSCKRGNWQTITQALVEMCATDLRPLSIVNGEGFKNFVKHLDPTYDIPSHTTVKNYTGYYYESLKKALLVILKSCKCVAYTTDTWTSCATEGFLTLTIHFIDTNWNLNSYVLATSEIEGHHTGEHLADEIRSILSKFQLTDVKVAGITTDNAANNVTMTRSLQWRHIRCFAHTLQLSVKAGLKVQQIAETSKAARKLVTHFRKSTLAKTDLNNKQKQLNLKQHVLISDSATRWNSTYLMFERLLEQRLAIFAVLHNSDIVKPSDARGMELTGEQWQIMEDVVSVLKPFLVATTAISGQKYPTLSLVYPMFRGILINHLKINHTDSAVVISFKEAATEDMKTRLPLNNDVCQHPVVIACALDPAYKKLKFLSEEQRNAVTAKIKSLMSIHSSAAAQREEESPSIVVKQENVEANMDTAQSAMQFLLGDLIDLTDSHEGTDSVEVEFNNYFADTSPAPAGPLAWWKCHENTYPSLALLAKEYLCIPGTSVPSERVFSDTGNLVTKRRAALDPDSIDQIIFIRNYLKNHTTSVPRDFMKREPSTVSSESAANSTASDQTVPELPRLPDLPSD